MTTFASVNNYSQQKYHQPALTAATTNSDAVGKLLALLLGDFSGHHMKEFIIAQGWVQMPRNFDTGKLREPYHFTAEGLCRAVDKLEGWSYGTTFNHLLFEDAHPVIAHSDCGGFPMCEDKEFRRLMVEKIIDETETFGAASMQIIPNGDKAVKFCMEELLPELERRGMEHRLAVFLRGLDRFGVENRHMTAISRTFCITEEVASIIAQLADAVGANKALTFLETGGDDVEKAVSGDIGMKLRVPCSAHYVDISHFSSYVTVLKYHRFVNSARLARMRLALLLRRWQVLSSSSALMMPRMAGSFNWQRSSRRRRRPKRLISAKSMASKRAVN